MPCQGTVFGYTEDKSIKPWLKYSWLTTIFWIGGEVVIGSLSNRNGNRKRIRIVIAKEDSIATIRIIDLTFHYWNNRLVWNNCIGRCIRRSVGGRTGPCRRVGSRW